MSRRGWVLFSAMCVIWGIPYLLIKVAVSDLSAVDVIFGRCIVAVVLLLPVAAVRGELRPLLPHWKPLLAYTVVEIGVPWLLLPVAEEKLPSSLTGLLVAAVPLIGTLLAFARGATHELGLARIAGLVDRPARSRRAGRARRARRSDSAPRSPSASSPSDTRSARSS